ncbi:MAG: phosphoribosylformylglycinamidine cyclo-ligase [candidate division KSB1 bacterium]|nr:phosphoribosylformylglycinamidine cyclo-ligase [candidate division KSB1 bacterium]MDZ7301592.1 phosphoribosylformylglycinamidine cyclo-ligase [candidate division KSB1 bacterium]MDZ7310992.1 phosphoribosylformylglycinamidine cyclo-ligase [candidate division KSB1 bacterium]
MGIRKSPSPAALFMAVLFAPEISVEQVRAVVTKEFGEILLQSPVYLFTHSDYYAEEMGGNLQKVFLLLNRLIDPATLVDWKLRAREVETEHARHGRRTINLDPGYLDASKLVLATTKNYDHRIYLDRGIYGDVQLRFRFQKFHVNDWTYPDYRQPEHIAFFEQARLKYFDLLKTEFAAPESFEAASAPAARFDYKSAGVDREQGESVKKKIGELARRTFNENVLREIGLFGGFFRFSQEQYREPVLVASVDGIGTKIKLACQLNRHRGLGEDIVHHCLNDIMVAGAEPLFFLDYLALGKLEPAVVLELVAGMSAACQNAGCALIGGETAEMPDIYHPGEFDLAGTIVGVVEKEKILDGRRIESGDVLLGIASNGLHTNGYSLARKILAAHPELALDQYQPELGEALGEALLRPHRSYQQAIRLATEFSEVHGISHITGGGIEGNTIRLLHNGLQLKIDWQAWEWPPLFRLLQKLGQVEEAEMRRVFNLGIGLVFVVAPTAVDQFRQRLTKIGERSWVMGEVL